MQRKEANKASKANVATNIYGLSPYLPPGGSSTPLGAPGV